MSSGIKMVGDWRTGIENPLRFALAASVEICGRNMAEACKHAIILMAQSAAKETPQAKVNRQVLTDDKKRKYVEVYKQGNSTPKRFYQFRANVLGKYLWENARKIGNRGLAKRSWMWGLKGLNVQSGSRPLYGVTTLKTIATEKYAGYILTDRLKYLPKILRPGWEQRVRMAAENRIMKQAQMKLEREWATKMRGITRGAKSAGRAMGGIGRYFLRAA